MGHHAFAAVTRYLRTIGYHQLPSLLRPWDSLFIEARVEMHIIFATQIDGVRLGIYNGSHHCGAVEHEYVKAATTLL